MIREATLDDLDDLVRMQKVCRASGALGKHDADAARNGLSNLITMPTATMLRSDYGMIGGFLMPQWDAPTWTMAVEMVWWAGDGQWLPLLRRFGEWAESSGAGEIRITTEVQSKSARIGQALNRAGFDLREMSYRRVI